jgi:hypothetical protein
MLSNWKNATIKHSTTPFPYWVVDGAFDGQLLMRAAAEFPDSSHPGWRWFRNKHELKAQGVESMMGPECKAVMAELQSVQFRNCVSELTGIDDLIASAEGGGMHMIPPGGFLGIHADFNRSSEGLYRRVNALLYLNFEWESWWGGQLELHDKDGCKVDIEPMGNRLVLFETSSVSFHGHPNPTDTRAMPRKSLATYYFTELPPPGVQSPHSTVFKEN